MSNLTLYDDEIRALGYAGICGVDEAGRGPLAGSVYAAAVILPLGIEILGVNDSKKLTHTKRERLFEEITAVSQYCIATADCGEIDAHNILGATLLAMRRCVQGLPEIPDCVLVDGNTDPRLEIPTRLVVKGDATSACIAAASILAKVARDRYMLELDALYPQYGFASHKGYPTKAHYAQLDIHGPCPAHRQSFLKKWRAAKA